MNAGTYALNFCNSVDQRPRYLRGDLSAEGDHLATLTDLLQWIQKADLLKRGQREEVFASCRKMSEPEAAKLLCQACELRELLFNAFFHSVIRGSLDASTTQKLNQWYRKIPRPELHAEGRGLRLTSPEFASVDIVFIKIAEDAIMLLASERLARVKFCADEECGWLFLDQSKNGSRRWCDMGDCGNREKARRFYRQHAG